MHHYSKGFLPCLLLLCTLHYGCQQHQQASKKQEPSPAAEYPPTKKDVRQRASVSASIARVGRPAGGSEKSFRANDRVEAAKRRWSDWVRRHPFSNRSSAFIQQIDRIPKRDRPDLAAEQDFMMTVDPVLGTVPKDRLFFADQQAQDPLLNGAINGISWVERGPVNVAGRTRALAFDPNDGTNKKVWAGGVGGGLWYTTDITASSPVWTHVDDLWDNIAISSISFDPSNTQNIYVGTGEGWSNSDAQSGGGIWKSANGGSTWSRLASTDPSTSNYFKYVNKLAVTSSGVVLAATFGNYTNTGGIMRSTDGGASWTNALSTYSTTTVEDVGADIEIAANGHVFASFGYLQSSGKVFKSTDGGLNWTDISASVVMGSARRVELACAPSDANVIYAMAADYPSSDADMAWVKKSTDGGTTWSSLTIPKLLDDPLKHFTRSQGYYDLILQVHPTNADIVLAGGIDLHRSIDGGTNWTGISHWYGGFSKPEVHADQHAIVFRPGNPSQAIFGNDGGVFYSTNAGSSGVSPTFSSRNNGYNITQFYSVSGRNQTASNVFLAGAQDNGTQSFSLPSTQPTREVTGGDGAFAHIDQLNSDVQISSYTFCNFYRSLDDGVHFPSISGGTSDGRFINPTAYDSQRKILYAAAAANNMRRLSGMTGTITQTDLVLGLSGGTISALKVSSYNDVVFIGTGSGLVYKVADASTATPTVTRIDNGATPITTTGYVSCIDVGADDNQVLVTYSNYGVTSVWETINGGALWRNKEGNLPDMPVRWVLYNPSNRDKVLLATELGVWSTDNFAPGTATAPVWGSSNTNLARTRCNMFYYRTADKQVAVATHGRGLFTMDAFASSSVADFAISSESFCGASLSVQFTDGSLNPNESWAWDIDNDGDTDYTTQNPSHTYTTPGLYTVKLTINNGAASTIKRGAFVVMASAPTSPTVVCSTADANTSNTYELGIFRVTLSNLDHTTVNNDGPYQNYACTKYALLNVGTTYSVSVWTGSLNAESARLFIDYNDNGTFDAGEEAAAFSTLTGRHTATFTTPTSGVVLRKGLRMRFVSKFSSSVPANGCDRGNDGQIEDYTAYFEPEYTWTGAVSTAWNTAGNWSPAVVPSSADHVVIPDVSNDPLLPANTSVGSLTLGTGGILSLNNFGLTVTGNLTGTGVLKGSVSSSLTVNGPSGTVYFDQTTAGATNALKTLTLSGSAVTTLGSTLQIAAGSSPGTVSVGGSAQLVTGGFLTLRSDADGTARINELTSSSSAPVSGTVTVERYIAAGRKWRLLTAPLKGAASNSIFANWQNNDVVAGSTGAEIWGSAGHANPGTDNTGLASGLGNSMRKFAANAWSAITQTHTEQLFGSTTNNGFALFVTGPYQNGNGNIASGQAATTLRSTGSLITGDHVKSLSASSANEYFLVGNPYASSVRPALIELSSGLAGNFWMWDASDVNFGRYVAFDRSLNLYSLGGGSGFSNTGPTPIQSGQAFFVKANSSGSSTVTFRESYKTASVSGGMFGAQPTLPLERLRIHLQRRIGNEYPDADAAWAVFHPEGRREADRMDGSKLVNTSENLSLRREDRLMTFEYLPPLTRRDTLFLRFGELKLQEYRLEFEGMEWVDTTVQATLVDRYTGLRSAIDLHRISHHVFRADSSATDRYMIVLSRPAVPADAIRLQADVSGRSVRLDWTVTNGYELNTQVLERIDASGVSTRLSDYGFALDGTTALSFLDTDARVGDNRYRVTATGRSGLQTVSNIAVAALPKDEAGLTLFPNPVRDLLRISISASAGRGATISVVDARGRTMYRNRRLEGSGPTPIDVRAWPSGVYRVVLADETGTRATASFIKE